MELPKNITQIGESDKYCKIYVEDYVVSYVKQLNGTAYNKDVAVALYGNRRTENEVSYLFLYGACKLELLQKETRHLSQAQLQEIEKMRKKYFQEMEFLGYRLLNGEMVEGYHIFEQGICRYIKGYAQFYEKNDAMLTYMLAARQMDMQPEQVSLEKYEIIRKRQEERKGETTGTVKEGEPRSRKSDRVSKDYSGVGRTSPVKSMRVAVIALFGLLCITGVSMAWDQQAAAKWKMALGQAVAEFTEQKLPDAGELTATEPPAMIEIPEAAVVFIPETAEVTREIVFETTQTPDAAPDTVTAAPATAAPDAALDATPVPIVEETAVPEAEPVSYTIQKGDTLIRIAIRNYGNGSWLDAICELNGIEDPDDIKIGQKILLP